MPIPTPRACRNCGASLDEIHDDHKCPVCDAVFDPRGDNVARAPAGEGVRLSRAHRRVDTAPRELSSERSRPAQHSGGYRSEAVTRDDLKITWRWNSAERRRFEEPVLVTNAVLFGLWAFLFLAGWPPEYLLVVSLLLPIGLGLGYWALANRINRSIIEVRGDELSVRSGPLPGRGIRRFPVRLIEQLYTQEFIFALTGDEPVYVYTVFVRLLGGERLPLMLHVHTREQGLWIEQQIEDCLGLVDVVEPDEVESANEPRGPGSASLGHLY